MKNWPADKVERRSIDELIPYARNSRTHSEEQISQIAASMKEWGWTNPVLIDEDGGIIAGHGRVMAAQKLGYHEAPCMVAEGWTEAQKRAYVIADNKLALNADWDNDLLAVEFDELADLGFDLDLTGFDADEIDALKPVELTEGLTDEDEVPEAPDEPITRQGDVWVLGRHKIVCGDATIQEDWKKLSIEKGVVTFSSPPYNLGDSIKLSGNSSLNKGESAYDKYNDNASSAEYIDLIESALACGVCYCDVVAFNLQPLAKSKRPLMNLMSEHSDNLIDIITWDKGHAAPPIAKGVMASRYEWILMFSSKNKASRAIPHATWQGKWSNVYQAPPQRNNEFSQVHGATFPVHLPEFIVGDIMNRSRGVVDCFCGTGTTIIAAEKLGKIGYGIELDPMYCDVAVKRWQEFTGQDAVLDSSGKTYNELANA